MLTRLHKLPALSQVAHKHAGESWTNAEVDVLAERLAISYTDSDGSKQANHAKALSTARPSVADSSKSHKKRAHKPKTKAQPKYQSRKSQFIDEDVRDYLNGDYED